MKTYVQHLSEGSARLHRELMSDPYRRRYLYFARADVRGDYPALLPVLDGDPPPAGYEIATPEPIPTDRDLRQTHAWLDSVARSLPIL